MDDAQEALWAEARPAPGRNTLARWFQGGERTARERHRACGGLDSLARVICGAFAVR